MKPFDAYVNLVDVYAPTNGNDEFGWEFIDVSDEVQHFFNIDLRDVGLTVAGVTIELRNKINNTQTAIIELNEKNIIKFVDSYIALQSLDNLNAKYELVWCTLNGKFGIIYFDHKLAFKVN